MPPAEKGVVKAPNQGEFSTDRRSNGFLPLTPGPGSIPSTNLSRFMHGDAGGSADMTRQGTPISPPNAGVFKAGDVGRTDQAAPAAVQPGKGAVPVNPFLKSGSIVPASEMRDSAKK